MRLQAVLREECHVFTTSLHPGVCPLCSVPILTYQQGGRVHYTHALAEASYDNVAFGYLVVSRFCLYDFAPVLCYLCSVVLYVALLRCNKQEVKVIDKMRLTGGPFPGYGSPQGVESCTIEFLG